MDPQAFRILERKRDGHSLSQTEIETVAQGAASGDWPEAELGAFLMASIIRGLDADETRYLTLAMLESGEQWDLARDFPEVGDKHSTGGVGDKVSLIFTPLMAACDRPIAMLTGRGLGHTGGTADKLDVIPGLDQALDRERACRMLEKTGQAIGMATDSIAPADRKLYALRDRTGTVASIELITASILSKKLATGASAVVYDIKTGNGAFLPDPHLGLELGRLLIEITRALGREASALITDMSQPLGRWSGHAAEIREVLDCLAGEGANDLMEVVYSLAEELAEIQQRPLSRQELEAAIHSGRARESFERWAVAQSADPAWIRKPDLPLAPHEVAIEASRPGHIGKINTRGLGELLAAAGGGRLKPDANIDFGISLERKRRLGDAVEEGEELARIYLRQPDAALEEAFRGCFTIADEATAPPVIHQKVRLETAG